MHVCLLSRTVMALLSAEKATLSGFVRLRARVRAFRDTETPARDAVPRKIL